VGAITDLCIKKGHSLQPFFGNEPDLQGISIDAYLKQWNSLIPVLRHINPDAKFIGPVVSKGTTEFIQGFLTGVKTLHVLPDAISFH
jgi:hypothetical protein